MGSQDIERFVRRAEMRPDAAWKLIQSRLLEAAGEEDIFTSASGGRVPVDPQTLNAAEETLTGEGAIHEDFGKVWMDYGHYGSDPDAPTDHDTSSWTPLDDVEDDPNETLLPTYVSMKRAEESVNRSVRNLSKEDLRSMIRKELLEAFSNRR